MPAPLSRAPGIEHSDHELPTEKPPACETAQSRKAPKNSSDIPSIHDENVSFQDRKANEVVVNDSVIVVKKTLKMEKKP
ncbi:MAG: hypothetical protein JXD23_14470 [Spirochaetales bacterium]|nr:hypothetical protein [Spirochaetales bacterium]